MENTKHKERISVVVPCFNEEGNIQKMYDEIAEIEITFTMLVPLSLHTHLLPTHTRARARKHANTLYTFRFRASVCFFFLPPQPPW